MKTFEDMVERVLQVEGGYVWDTRDPGSETKFGISKRSYPQVDIKALTREGAIALYRKDFWERARCDEIHPAIVFQVFDAAVNHGIGNAIRWLQRAVGVADDGVIGSMTLAAVGRRETADVVLLFNAERIAFYTKLSTFQVFGRGWMNRVSANLRFATQDN